MHPELSPDPARGPQRVAGFVLAMLVQAGFIALLVISRPTFAPRQKLTKELTLFLPRLPRAVSPPLALPAPSAGAPRSLVAPPTVPAPPSPNTLRAVPAAPDLSGLGLSLFGCAPEQWSSLSPEQRAKCPRPGEGLTAKNAPDLLHPPPSQSKDRDYWAVELQKRNDPIPTCMTFKRQAVAIGIEDYRLMVDPICAAKKLQRAMQ